MNNFAFGRKCSSVQNVHLRLNDHLQSASERSRSRLPTSFCCRSLRFLKAGFSLAATPLAATCAAAVLLGVPERLEALPLAQMQIVQTSPPQSGPKSARPQSSSSAVAAADAIRLLKEAEENIDKGRFQEALNAYTYITGRYGDLALAEYAKIGRSLCLYQVGRASDAILLLEDEEVTFRGSAQVHAALAALLYAERPSLAFRAEEEWDISQEFDKRYTDVEWVRTQKHWPPKALESLTRFLQLQ
ncbi:hypothetical protein DUNSADRAFT_10400 [Dunaliella salina]|uniref:Uncharacterized protein n=1 Tax=Dunaliella salina TaxID=3046 RepID=A0ABQ7GFL1_DUNSA|nr:hypothetical protein DUNSADRAFT_10400 [Dunaliella salina]|eukprot:KAF5833359.1 hypothetical protein DUNSADRAFT_10400 [Dunaliella salina]